MFEPNVTRFGGHVVLDATFAEIETLCEQVRLWDLDLRPLSAKAGDKSAGRLMQIHDRDFSYGYCALNTCVDQYGTAPPDAVTFVFKGSNTGKMWWRSLDTDENEVLVYKPGSEVRCINSPDFDIQTISIPWHAILATCESLKLTCPELQALPETIKVAATQMVDMRVFLNAYREAPNRGLSTATLPLLEHLIRSWVAQSQTRASSSHSISARDRAIHICLEFLDGADLAEVSMQDLRQISNVSDRTLQYVFRDRFSVTPQVFLRSLRLSRVHAMLKQEDHHAISIGELATSQGLWHHGRFSQEYSRIYGETPSATRDSLRI